MEKLSLQICERSPRNEGLAEILRQMISKSAKELIAEYKAEKKQNPSGDVLKPKVFVSIQRSEDADVLPVKSQRKQPGRKLKNPVIGEKVVCFNLPEDCGVESIKDIDKVQERLGKWRIQRRQRNTMMNYMYYCHLSSRQTFRSIPEVLSFIMCEYHSMPSQKRSVNDQASRNKVDSTTSESPPKKAREDTEKLEEISQEGLIMSEPPLNLMDTSQESVENGMDSTLEMCNLYMFPITYEEQAYLEFEHDEYLLALYSSANEKDVGQAGSSALVTAEPVQALPWINEVNEVNQKFQENFGTEKIETLQDALEKLVHVPLEGVDDN